MKKKKTRHLAILHTYYEIYATGETIEELKKNVVKGYEAYYPNKHDRSVEDATFEALREYFGVTLVEIDLETGYTSE